MILEKKLKFFHLFSLSKIDREKLFADVLDKKETIKEDNNDCLRKTQIRISPKGLVHRFGQKFELFLTLVFMQNRPRKSIWERAT